MVPWVHQGHESVLSAAYLGTSIIGIAFIIADLLYLVRLDIPADQLRV